MAINEAGNPIVMFAQEWCEFCWSARKAFAHFGIPYRSVELDRDPYSFLPAWLQPR